MPGSSLFKNLAARAEFQDILNALEDNRPVTASGLEGTSKVLLTAELFKVLGKSMLVIVPNEEESLVKESAASLQDRLEEAMAPFTRNGVRFGDLIAQSLLTPSCGLALISEEASARVLELLTELSARIRQRYR